MILLAALAALLLLAEAARAMASAALVDRVQRAADRRGWAVQIDELTLSWDLSLHARGLRAATSGDDPRSTLALESLDARWTLDALLGGERAPQQVKLRGLTADLHRADLMNTLERHKNRGGVDGEGAREGGGASTSGDRPSLDSTLVDLSGAALTLRGMPVVDTLALKAVEVSNDAEGRWRGAARCEQGCGEAMTLRGSARVSPKGISASASFERPLSLTLPLPHLDAQQALSFSEVGAEISDEGVLLSAAGISADIDQRGIKARVTAARASASVDLDALKGAAAASASDARPEGERGDLSGAAADPGLLSAVKKVRVESPRVVILEGPALPMLDEDDAGITPPKGGKLPEGKLPPGKLPPGKLPPGKLAPGKPLPDKQASGRSSDKRPRSKAEAALDLAVGAAERVRRGLGEAEALADRALPLIEGIEVEDGAVSWPAREIEIAGIEAGRREGAYRIGARAMGLSAWVEARAEAPRLKFGVEGLPLSRIMALGPVQEAVGGWKPLRGVDGQLSGWITVSAVEEVIEREGDDKPAAAPERRQGLKVQGSWSLEGGSLDIDGLAPEPIVEQRARLDLDATWWPPGPGGDALDLRQIAVTLPSQVQDKEATLRLSAKVERLIDPRKPLKVALRIWLEETDCAVAVGAIPRAMLPNIRDHLKVEGAFAPELTFSVDLGNLNGIKLDVQGLPGTCKVTDLGEFSPDYLAGDFKFEVTEGVTREGIFVGPQTGSYAPIRGLPMHLRVATYVSEEWNFYKNKGFDLMRTTGAIRLNLEKGRYVYGGSTLTQQLVKNRYLRRQKTLSRKLEEAFIVWRMEEVLTKDRILELYLNCIEFGPNLYGISRAASHYFGKSPSALTLLEGVFLASIKPFPWIGGGVLREGHTPDEGYWPQRLQSIMTRMKNAGHLSEAEFNAQAPFVVYFKTWKGPRPKPNLAKEADAPAGE